MESGADPYWISDDGYYFSTDNPLFDPRTDPRMRDREWAPAEIER